MSESGCSQEEKSGGAGGVGQVDENNQQCGRKHIRYTK
jgi:hypothetical protein